MAFPAVLCVPAQHRRAQMWGGACQFGITHLPFPGLEFRYVGTLPGSALPCGTNCFPPQASAPLPRSSAGPHLLFYSTYKFSVKSHVCGQNVTMHFQCVLIESESSLGWKGPSSPPSPKPCHGDTSFWGCPGPTHSLGHCQGWGTHSSEQQYQRLIAH